MRSLWAFQLADLTLLATVDELASVHAFSSHEELFSFLVSVGITKVNHRQGCTTTGIVDDVLVKEKSGNASEKGKWEKYLDDST